MNLLANALTLISLAFGFVSIVFSLQDHFTFASWAILVSVFFDGIDGQIARRNVAPSAFGRELDSLVDVVSFGIAPSVLGFIFVCAQMPLRATLALFLYLSCSIIRLAKYNVTPKEAMSWYFYGLPTTASGGVLASFVLVYRRSSLQPPAGLFLALVLALAFLMVSRARYLNIDGLRRVLGRYALVAFFLAFGLCAWLAEAGILSLFTLYLVSAPFLVRRLTT